MKQFAKLPLILTLICLSLHSFGQGIVQKVSLADQPAHGPSHTTGTSYAPVSTASSPSSSSVVAKNGMTAEPRNYRSFTAPYKNSSEAARVANRGFENHPEAGLLFPGTPCDNCYELIEKRTEISKTFEKPTVDGGKDVMVATANMPMHYRDAAGNWRTIKTHLAPSGNGVYAATEQPVPVIINAQNRFSSIGAIGENIRFNNNLELIYLKPDGTEVSLGAADWTHHTAGDQGAYVTNAWPGVDIEMSVMRGAVKTNFYINHAMPAYADGKLLVRDHFHMDRGLSLNTGGRKKLIDFLTIRNNAGDVKYSISAATVFEKNDYENTMNMLEYSIGENNAVDIVLPGNYLRKPAAAYPIVIDPLVSTSPGTSTVVNGCTYNAGWTAGIGCSYMNIATTPANVTVTDIQFSFEYTGLTSALEFAAFSFYKGACRSPGSAAGGLSWSCLTPLTGTCTAAGGAAYSIFADMAPCIPPPQCAPYNLNIQMLFYQNWLTTAPCSITYYYGSQPLTFIVFGHTVELTAAGVTGGPSPICAGQSATIAATGTYGVPPYTYSWLPGPVAGSPAVVSPTVTTVYNLTVTDLCGITTTGSTTIVVNPTTPITGTLSVCIGNNTTLNNATAGGVWTSGTPGVATVVAGTGVVTGAGTGTSVITYTTPAGCKAFATVTVTPLPVAITGILFMCQGATTTLSDLTPGGAWSSSAGGTAGVSAAGVVTGVSAGTATITYGTPGCVATIDVTVNPTPHISGTGLFNPTTCNGTDGTITLSGLTAGETYSVHYISPTGAVTVSIVADGSGNVVITNLGGGNYTTISVTNSFGCVSNVVGPILLVASGNPPAPALSNSSPVCDGGTVNFTGTDAATGVTYNWSGPAGFTSTLQNPVIPIAGLSANGTYTATVTLAGCTSSPATTVVTINPVPSISIINSAGPTSCQGTDATITIQITGMAGNITYNVAYTDDGVAVGNSFTSNAGNVLVITGLSSGTFNGINITTAAGCTSNSVGPVVLTDPGAPPVPTIKSNTPVCVGQTLVLQGDDLAPGGIFTWTFANGATSTVQNPEILNTTAADIGNYTLSYNIANCISALTTNIMLYPPIVLTGLTPNTEIAYGSSIQLNVQGALDYWWRPDDGSLNNPNINNPIASPKDSTVYTVVATSQWGCMDSAHVTITVNGGVPVVIPSAFTPNGDGLNDVFRVGNLGYQKVVEFSVYNRWGQLVYHNTYDPKAGWDGSYNGVIQDMGNYNYVIIVANPDGTNVIYKGDVTLIK